LEHLRPRLRDLLQQIDVGFGVVCRRVDAPVPEDQSNLFEGNAMTQHLGRRCVSQDMCAFGRAHNTSPLHRASHRGRYAITALEWSVGGNISNEDMVAIAIGGWRPAREVGQDRISNVLREGQSNLVATLPGDAQCAGLPLNIRDAKPRDVASSEPEPCQEKDDCSVTPACR
jgi:hypothetical protein